MRNGCGCVEDPVCFEYADMSSVGCPSERRRVAARENSSSVRICWGLGRAVMERLNSGQLQPIFILRENGI